MATGWPLGNGRHVIDFLDELFDFLTANKDRGFQAVPVHLLVSSQWVLSNY